LNIRLQRTVITERQETNGFSSRNAIGSSVKTFAFPPSQGQEIKVKLIILSELKRWYLESSETKIDRIYRTEY
jgi:hypothetical protein